MKKYIIIKNDEEEFLTTKSMIQALRFCSKLQDFDKYNKYEIKIVNVDDEKLIKNN